MSVYMTEEEQLEAIKKFWKKHQQKIMLLVSCVLLVTAAVRYWNWHIEKRDQNASMVYEQLMQAFTKEDAPSTEAYAKTLVSQYTHTVYADAASLLLAKLAVEKKAWDEASRVLKQVAEHGQTPAIRDVAKFRLARILVFQKQYDDALKTVEGIQTIDASTLDRFKNDIHSAKKLS